MVLVLAWCFVSAEGATAAQGPKAVCIWEEHTPCAETTEEFEKEYSTHQQSRRGILKREWLSFRRVDDEPNPDRIKLDDDGDENENRTLPHPLRTDLFKLNVRWKSKIERGFFGKEVEFEFHPDGLVRGMRMSDMSLTEEDSSSSNSQRRQQQRVLGIGTWKLYPWGVEYSIQATNGYIYLFQASVHLNPFGKQPKLSHGTVLREQSLDGGGIRDEEMDEPYLHIPRRKWFRPVVASFQGIGIGEDTADFSYKNRGVGLSS